MKKYLRKALSETVGFTRWLYQFARNPKTKRYHHDNVKVVVIGNGPSAKSFPYKHFEQYGYDFCCVNFFALDEALFFSLKPRFYCCIDPAFTDDAFRQTTNGAKLISVLERVDWDMIFLCTKGRSVPVSNEHITFHYINKNTFPGEINSLRNILFNRNIASCGFQNVIVSALYYFIMAKASEIVLTGVENDWHKELSVGADNNVYREDTHFYGVERLNLTQKGEIGKGELYKYFYFYYITLYQYAIVSGYAERNHISIYNTCLNSFIDVFPKRSSEKWL